MNCDISGEILPTRKLVRDSAPWGFMRIWSRRHLPGTHQNSWVQKGKHGPCESHCWWILCNETLFSEWWENLLKFKFPETPSGLSKRAAKYVLLTLTCFYANSAVGTRWLPWVTVPIKLYFLKQVGQIWPRALVHDPWYGVTLSHPLRVKSHDICDTRVHTCI
jgi:hypothetical protein